MKVLLADTDPDDRKFLSPDLIQETLIRIINRSQLSEDDLIIVGLVKTRVEGAIRYARRLYDGETEIKKTDEASYIAISQAVDVSFDRSEDMISALEELLGTCVHLMRIGPVCNQGRLRVFTDAFLNIDHHSPPPGK